MGQRRKRGKEESEEGKGTLVTAVAEGRPERRRPSLGGEGWREQAGSGRERWTGGGGWSWETVWRRKGTERAARSRGKQQMQIWCPG